MIFLIFKKFPQVKIINLLRDTLRFEKKELKISFCAFSNVAKNINFKNAKRDKKIKTFEYAKRC